jgi:hypothetical protein
MGTAGIKNGGGSMTDTRILQELQNMQQDIQKIRQRVERIEGALLRVLNLVEPMVLDRRKVHAGMQKHTMLYDGFVTAAEQSPCEPHKT